MPNVFPLAETQNTLQSSASVVVSKHEHEETKNETVNKVENVTGRKDTEDDSAIGRYTFAYATISDMSVRQHSFPTLALSSDLMYRTNGSI